MSRPRLPTAPDASFGSLMAQVRALEGARLASAVPPDCLRPRPWRGLAGFATSYLLYAGALVAVAHAHWVLQLPLYLLAGLGGWGLHCIAHDCGHQSFSRSRRLNSVIGQLALLPLLYPFHAWRHVHNLHHLHTNHLELDTDWRPLSAEVHARLPRWERLLYSATRSWAFWAGTIRYWALSAFRPGFFPKREMRRDAWQSIVVVLVAGLVYLALLAHATGAWGLLRYFVCPWLAIHLWFSTTTLMHHVRGDLPFLPGTHWTPNASRLLLTVDYRYPRPLEFLTHYISLHTAHHVVPAVPFYHLPAAQAALKQAYPGLLREHRFSFAQLLHILRDCRFYDSRRGYYRSARRAGRDEPLAAGEAVHAADATAAAPDDASRCTAR